MVKKIRWEVRAKYLEEEFILNFKTRKEARSYKKTLKAYVNLYESVKMYRVSEINFNDGFIASFSREAR